MTCNAGSNHLPINTTMPLSNSSVILTAYDAYTLYITANAAVTIQFFSEASNSLIASASINQIGGIASIQLNLVAGRYKICKSSANVSGTMTLFTGGFKLPIVFLPETIQTAANSSSDISTLGNCTGSITTFKIKHANGCISTSGRLRTTSTGGAGTTTQPASSYVFTLTDYSWRPVNIANNIIEFKVPELQCVDPDSKPVWLLTEDPIISIPYIAQNNTDSFTGNITLIIQRTYDTISKIAQNVIYQLDAIAPDVDISSYVSDQYTQNNEQLDTSAPNDASRFVVRMYHGKSSAPIYVKWLFTTDGITTPLEADAFGNDMQLTETGAIVDALTGIELATVIGGTPLFLVT